MRTRRTWLKYCSNALARTGVGYLKLIDFDIVEPSNLNRQSYYVEHLGMFKTDALKRADQKNKSFY